MISLIGKFNFLEGGSLKVYDYTPMFSPIFTKLNSFCDFLFASLDDVAISKWGSLLQERICSTRSKLFPLRLIFIEKEAKIKMSVSFP